jgi:outer membrane protein TolC
MKYTHFPIILSCLVNLNLSAQKSALSLGICIERAQKNSFIIQAGEKEVETAQQKYLYMRSQSLPQIGGELSADSHRLAHYSFDQKSALLSADWPLGDYLLNTAQNAKLDKLIAQTDVQQQRLDVSQRCAMLYIHILLQQERRKLLQQRFDLLDAHYNVAKALWQSGIRTQFDLLQTEAEMDRLKEDMIFLELDRRNFLQELAQLINEKNAEDFELQPLNTESICNQQLPEFEAETLNRIPAVVSLDLRIKAQQLQSKTVTAQLFPHLYGNGGFVQDGDPTGDGNYWQASVGISLPLFRWGAIGFQKRESRALGQALDFRKQETERNLLIITNQITQRLTELKDISQLQQNRLKTTQNAFKAAEANYQAGLMTNLEYLSAQQQLNETLITIQETQLDYTGALVQLYIITNQLDKINEL